MRCREPWSMLGLLALMAVFLAGVWPASALHKEGMVVPVKAAITGPFAEAKISTEPVPFTWQANWVTERVDGEKHFMTGDHSLALDAAGYPHVVYGGGQVCYAWYDGTTWQIEQIEGQGISAYGPALALDSTGSPHVIYSDSTAGALKYARRNGSTWQIETLVSAASGVGAALVLDSADRPHVSYFVVGADPLVLMHTYFDGIAWRSDTIEELPTDGGGKIALAIDAADYLHVAYNGGGVVRYDYWDGTLWATTTVTNSASALSLALDATGLPHLAFQSADGWRVQYAWYDGATWQIENVGNCGYLRGPSLAIGPDGRPRLSFRCWDAALQYRERTETGWIEPSIVESWGLDPSLVIDGEGHAHVIYCLQNHSGMTCRAVKYASNDGTGWVLAEVDRGSEGYFDGPISLAVDAAGQPHLGYFDTSCEGGCLKYAAYDGNSWRAEVVANPGWPCWDCTVTLAVDSAGRPHLAYNDSDGALHYAYNDGSAWVITNLGWLGYGVSLALDGSDNLHLSFFNESAQLVYAWYAGGVWSSDVVGIANSVGSTSMAVDSEGLVHIAYAGRSYSLIKYAHTVEKSPGPTHTWQVELVDVVDLHSTLSLALGPGGSPHLGYSYYERNMGDLHFKYAYRDAFGWHTETVESSARGDSSLAVDAYGRPHIALPWSQPTYHYYDGGEWITSTVDANYTFGGPISLALDEAGMPHLGYQAENEVRYAHLATCIPAEGLNLHGPADVSAGITTLYTSTYTPLSATLPAVLWDRGIVGPTAAYSWTVTGEQTLTATLATPCGQVTDTLTVNVFCQPLQGVDLAGPVHLSAGISGWYTSSYTPVTASLPLTRTWSNGRFGRTAVYSWTTPGTYTVTMTATNACSQADAILTTTVFCQPPDGLTVQGARVAGIDQPMAYYSSVQPITASRPLSYTWSNGFTGSHATYSWPVTGTYTVTVTGTNACGQVHGDFTVQVLIQPYHIFVPNVERHISGWCIPVEDLALSGPLSLPVNTTAFYTATYLPFTATRPVNVSWNNGTISATAAYSWSIPGVYSVAATAANACGYGSATAAVTVTGFCQPVETVAITGSLTLLPGEVGLYTATYGPPTATLPVSLTWAGGASGPTAAYSWTVPGDYTVTVTVTNACGQTSTTLTITVAATCQPVETVAITGSLVLLPGEVGLYTATYMPLTATLPVSLTWDGGAGGATATYSWTVPGVYTVTVTATNACGLASSSFTVTVASYVATQWPDASLGSAAVSRPVSLVGSSCLGIIPYCHEKET